MATCKCGTYNEYQDEPYVCRDCRDKMPDVFNEGGVVVGVDPGVEPAVVVAVGMAQQRAGKNALQRHYDEICKAATGLAPGEYVFRQGDFTIARDMPVRGPCAPWQPDAAAVAAKENEILDLVLGGTVSEFDRSSITKLRTLQDELLTLRTDPDEIQEALDLWDEIKSLRDELEQLMKNMPQAVRSKVYGS